MAIQRVALIFDDRHRPETTGVYCRQALSQLVEVEHFRAADISRLPQQALDLYLRIDDGLDYELPHELHPSAWWVIDTHLNFERDVVRARDFDFVFAAQRDGAERLRHAGITSASWLPLACDPRIHGHQDVEKQYDLCFIGHLFPGPRAELVELLRRTFPRTFVGQRYFEEMARTYSASRIVFNRSLRNDVNMRVFEGVASGSLLLTNELRSNGQEELFRDGVHLATYRDAEELLDKARFYLSHDAERERIAVAGRAEAVAHHTYRHRMEQLLRVVESRCKPGPRTTRPAPTDAIHDHSYFAWDRPELLALVPVSARRVLDIGCGAGQLGRHLKVRQPVEVIGIELDTDAARVAVEHLDRVLVGNVEVMELSFAERSLDAVICGDVLEHLRQPATLLRRINAWLRPDGRLIASIPNVRHHSVVRSVLGGNWTYECAGLLDRDHVRFFTGRAIHQLFADTGFTIERVQIVPGPGHAEWRRQGCPGAIQIGQLHVNGLPPADAEEFFIYQYLVVAAPTEAIPVQEAQVHPDEQVRRQAS
jgi:2-polyprenyl-3-methyl-5-hydroxy-6-metoxy-1,4-benzoquinol methylase